MLHPANFRYVFNKGPIAKNELTQFIKEGNCRLAVQLYFFKVHNLYLEPQDVLCPRSFKFVGRFVQEPKEGDIVYAQRIGDKKFFPDEDSRIIFFHTAIYSGNSSVWHATALEGKSCVWPLAKFHEFYRVIAVKRVLLGEYKKEELFTGDTTF